MWAWLVFRGRYDKRDSEKAASREMGINEMAAKMKEEDPKSSSNLIVLTPPRTTKARLPESPTNSINKLEISINWQCNDFPT
jgi:hypothetical protein